MNLLLFPGKSKESNFSSFQELKSLIDKDFKQFTPSLVIYEHWKNENIEASVESEVNKVEEEINNLDNYSILSKSFGCVVAFKYLEKNNKWPSAMVCMGFPYNVEDSEEIKSVSETLRKINFPLVFIQQKEDKVLKADKIRKYFKDNNFNFKLIEIEGFDHKYINYLDQLNELSALI